MFDDLLYEDILDINVDLCYVEDIFDIIGLIIM